MLVTLFFDESQLQFAIGLVLTVMLVMYTMYQGVSASLPKTAYLTFFDAWVFFCLLVPFIVFLIEVYWEICRTKRMKKLENNSTKTVGWIKKEKIVTIPYRAQIQISVIFCTVVFILFYIGVAIQFKHI